MAEGLLKDRVAKAGLADRVTVRSAGTWAGFGQAASDHGVVIASQDGIDIAEHRSHPLTRELVAGADLILVMTPEHRADIIAGDPEAADRTYLLTLFADPEHGNEGGVDDPIGGDIHAYRQTYRELAGLIDAALPKIRALAVPEETAP